MTSKVSCGIVLGFYCDGGNPPMKRFPACLLRVSQCDLRVSVVALNLQKPRRHGDYTKDHRETALGLRQDLFDHLAGIVRESFVAAVVAKRKPQMSHSDEVENRRVDIVDMRFVFGGA